VIERPGEYKIGRRYDAFININDPYISELHAKLFLSDSGDMKISDCGSRNGTYLNGVINPIKNETTIIPGDRIYLGRSERFVFELIKQ